MRHELVVHIFYYGQEMSFGNILAACHAWWKYSGILCAEVGKGQGIMYANYQLETKLMFCEAISFDGPRRKQQVLTVKKYPFPLLRSRAIQTLGATRTHSYQTHTHCSDFRTSRFAKSTLTLLFPLSRMSFLPLYCYLSEDYKCPSIHPSIARLCMAPSRSQKARIDLLNAIIPYFEFPLMIHVDIVSFQVVPESSMSATGPFS